MILSKYEVLLNAGVSVVAANTLAQASDWSTWQLWRVWKPQPGNPFFLPFGTCPGLPIRRVLRDIMMTGDQILRIEAVFSSAFGRILDRLKGHSLKESISMVLGDRSAIDVLSGQETTRRMVALVREMGIPITLGEIEVEGLLPDPPPIESESFFHWLERAEQALRVRVKKAVLEGRTLKYLATFEPCRAWVGLSEIEADHPFFHLNGCDRAIAVRSRRYRESPLVLKGKELNTAEQAAVLAVDLFRNVSLYNNDPF